ncbi:hypothetical protein [Grimontia sp. NTOU-MAR1]|uniref:hypothetical protein n=1 Tax=Grimontia sp. NTOU-MAR1 TaxID=3111011 RepID=UPI002DB9D7DD|nr:hypothetical protein [Grimontia sp. NTOU-MAR1]WRV99908.1 hypothetical protein VP504_23280 [Grimontia sp. NTOU-MAR1]
MTSTNKKGALLFAVGLLLGGLVAWNHWSSVEIGISAELNGVKTALSESQLALENAQEKLAQLNSQVEEAVERTQSLTQQIEDKDTVIVALKATLGQKSKAYIGKTDALEKEMEAQSVAIAQLKKRVTDTDALYEERYKLTKTLGDLNEEILKGAHKLELSQKACSEYKKGNSWNKVSQNDCDNFNSQKAENNAMIQQFDHMSSDLDKVKRELAAFGNVPLPDYP